MPNDTLKPLNGGELPYEQYVGIGEPSEESNEPLVRIIDAEGDFVCAVPISAAPYMVRLLNTYETVNDDAD